MPKTSLPAANLVTSVAALVAAQARSEPGWPNGAGRRPQDDTRTTGREQNPLVTEGERSTVGDRCCHMPPRLGCAKRHRGPGQPGGISISFCTQINEHTFLFGTLRPLHR